MVCDNVVLSKWIYLYSEMILRQLEDLPGFKLTNIHYAENIMLKSYLKGKRKEPLNMVVKKNKKKN